MISRLVVARPRRTLLLPALLALGLAPVGAAAESPGVLYMLHCQGCHLADGTGAPGAVPSLAGSLAAYLTVPGGRAYVVQVPGSASSRLDDAELAGVLNWMLLRFGPEAAARGAAPYTGEEVARLRSTPLEDVDGTRRRLREQISTGSPGRRPPGAG